MRVATTLLLAVFAVIVYRFPAWWPFLVFVGLVYLRYSLPDEPDRDTQ